MIFYNLLSTPWQVVELKSPTFLNHPKNEISNMLLPGEWGARRRAANAKQQEDQGLAAIIEMEVLSDRRWKNE